MTHLSQQSRDCVGTRSQLGRMVSERVRWQRNKERKRSRRACERESADADEADVDDDDDEGSGGKADLLLSLFAPEFLSQFLRTTRASGDRLLNQTLSAVIFF